ncbi:MAG: hypothetical protein EXR72_16500 [Myxococcales bacterium]|nr:hypothetical protein [Myxococcales bacterium]
MRPSGGLCALLLVGCTGPGAVDAAMPIPVDAALAFDAGTDAGSPRFCTANVCAADPCTKGCAFIPMPEGGCPEEMPGIVAREVAAACPLFCGFSRFGGLAEGCVRYRAEDPKCPLACVQWNTPACFERRPVVNYGVGGAICGTGFNCAGPSDGGTPPCDAGTPVDLVSPGG